VPRARFDQILADEAARQGADVRYEHEILAVDPSSERTRLVVRDASGARTEIEARFVLDASGFGRTLPRLLGLETPSTFPVRRALFTHVEDRIAAGAFDRQKIRVTVHPAQPDVWFWLIPFSNGRSSLGVVGGDAFFDAMPGGPGERLRALVAEDGGLARLLHGAVFDTPVNELRGYAANVKAMHGPGFALLGNAAEFLDPVFSSGVTIALKSASLAAPALDRQLRGEAVDWEAAFAAPLRRGVDAFRTYVNAWYDGRFQTVVFHRAPNPEVKAMICSLLAGYAWDERNPFVAQSERRLQTLYELCRAA
jgi:flavin-dependent dehydrogenase